MSADAAVDPVLARHVADGGRLCDEDALALLRSRDLLALGELSSERRQQLVPGDLVTYIVDRNINYTDICTTQCEFCAFYRTPESGDGYLLSTDEVFAKVQETLDLGGTAVMLQGGHHPDLDITYYEDLFSSIKARFDITIHSLSPPEILHIAKAQRTHRARDTGASAGRGPRLAARRGRGDPGRRGAGAHGAAQGQVRPLAGGDARGSPLGIKGTATMMFGSVETLADRVEHLRAHPRPAGRDGRLPGVHPLELPGGEHGAGRTDRSGHAPSTT